MSGTLDHARRAETSSVDEDVQSIVGQSLKLGPDRKLPPEIVASRADHCMDCDALIQRGPEYRCGAMPQGTCGCWLIKKISDESHHCPRHKW